ncbi:acylphosphatase [Shewanella sp. Scap07]|uniref:acylphosphatase n=1 Tax=Shewanella sp. Scap07 TaxID=2589987 RepID=UPI0015BEC806|nr:acylphosphatase [Shewanella sp. Scap07]QLE85908.1 acylphosphatase [Shewanella sp. Scap07]
MQRLRVTVTGKVQGVFFRRYTLDKANELGLTGYVSNLTSGEVEVLMQGGEIAAQALLDWLAQGSPMARVDSVYVEQDEAEEIYLDFSII